MNVACFIESTDFCQLNNKFIIAEYYPLHNLLRRIEFESIEFILRLIKTDKLENIYQGVDKYTYQRKQLFVVNKVFLLSCNCKGETFLDASVYFPVILVVLNHVANLKGINSKNSSSERLFVLSLVDTKKPKRKNVIAGLIDMLQTALHTKNCWKVGVLEFSCNDRKLTSAPLIRESKRLFRARMFRRIS